MVYEHSLTHTTHVKIFCCLFKILYQPFPSGKTESYCSDKEDINAGVAVGSWVNTNAQVLDFEFHLEVPLTEDNSLSLANLMFYSRYPEWYEPGQYNEAYDYDYYMAQMDEMNKFEVHFKCMKVEEPTPEPTPDPTAEQTTLEPTTNSFYLNGLDQEYLSILF